MKNVLLTVCFLCAFTAAFAQTNMYWFNPFGFNPVLSTTTSINIAKDTAGDIIMCSSNFNKIYVVNASKGVVLDSTVLFSVANYQRALYVDNGNRIWEYSEPYWWKHENDTTINVPVSGTDMVSDHAGHDYFLQWYADSIVLDIYDGTSVQTVSYPLSINSAINSLDGFFCDTSGAVFFQISNYGLLKYYQGAWTHVGPVMGGTLFLYHDDHDDAYFAGSVIYRLNCTTLALDSFAYPLTHFGFGWIDGYERNTNFICGPDGRMWCIEAFENTMYELNDSNTWSVVAAPGYNWLDTIGGYGYGVPGLFDRAGRLWITEGSDNFYFCAVGVYSFTPFNSIQGRVFYDDNGNGIADAGEHGFTAANIVQSTNGYYSNTDTAGRYAVVYIDSAISHTITAVVPPYYHLTTPASYTVAPTDSACCHDFGVRADGNIQDLRISAVSSTAIVGYPTVTWLDYQNVGTLTMSDTITYTYDTTLRYTTAWPAPSVVSGHTLSWSYQALAPLSTRGIMIEFALDPDPTLTGDTLLSTATIGPLVSDSTPADNAYLHQQIVTSAFDPNLKTVSPADDIAPGKNLTYTIHFQNTGTAPAINIVVYDTLDANLDPATFKLLGSSHPVSVLLTGKGILIFTFSNIQLPDSAADQAASNGFVQFSVSVSAPLHQPTATIANTASIVFDFNPPVQTNTAVASFYPAGIVTLPAGDRGQLQVMPNPAINSITISTTDDARDGMISLYDVTGKALRQTIVIGKYTTLDLQGFAAGIYMIRMHYPDGRTASCRLVKL